MATLLTPGAALHTESYGTGEPVTVFAHGVGASIAETRPLGGGVRGTRVFLQFRGHGASARLDGRWDYAALGADLRAVADDAGATAALGVSMGAAALLRLLCEAPGRFDRVVFFLPAVLDRPRSDVAFDRLAAMAALVDACDVIGLADMLLAELPAAVRAEPAARAYVAERSRALAGTGVSHLLRVLPPLVPVPDLALLAAVRAPALVLGQEGDDVHPASVARELAAALPRAELLVFPAAGAMWEPASRQRLRAAVSGFLNAPRPPPR